MKTGPVLVVLALGAVTPRLARAEPPLFEPGDRTTSPVDGEVSRRKSLSQADGVYGRFGGLFDLGLHAGAELERDGTSGVARVTLHYLFMAGVYASYADALGDDGIETARRVGFGVDMRPAFIPRWSSGMEDGPGLLDLAVDSISLSLGAYFREPRGRAFGDARGLELSLGFGVPLAASATGPWLGARGVLRWDDPSRRGHDDADAALLVTFGWHFAVGR